MLRIELAAGKNFNYAGAVKFNLRNPFFIFGLVLLWRVALLVFTAQPIPANDAFIFDGAVGNWLRHGSYVNPCMIVAYPISSQQVFSLYPPVYQVALLAWMPLFGTSALAMMTMHLALFALSAFLVLSIVKKFFPATANYLPAALLLFGITFGDRPEDLAHVFGLVSLGLVARQLAAANRSLKTAAAIALALLLALYTSVIAGAFYFGAGFLACAADWLSSRRHRLFVPFVAAAAMFAALTFSIAKLEPLWWQGFLENARQQSVITAGFHRPRLFDLLKLVRTAPVFLLAAAFLPFAFARRNQIRASEGVWPRLVAGIFLMGGILLVADMTLIAPDYVGYVIFTQILLAAGLLVLSETVFPEKIRLVRVLILGCVMLVSVRAVGMTTWGAACAWKNSYWRTQETLRLELAPFAKTDAPVVVSSAFLYRAQKLGVRHPIHSDWFYDRSNFAPDADFDGLVRLRPPKLVLTQFDYYRSLVPLLEKLRRHPELVKIQVRDLAAVRPPDASPSFQRVVQNISWAPVMVDLEWK
jgi:hypothetical protein